tara:strand:+ start:3912 stop:4883 length:972 start_codon:yes stop_codon:yes gene_type:complete
MPPRLTSGQILMGYDENNLPPQEIGTLTPNTGLPIGYQGGVLGQYNRGVNFLNPQAGALANNVLSGAMQNVAMPNMGSPSTSNIMGSLGKLGGVLGKGIGMLGGVAPVAAGLFGLMGLGASRRNRPKDINVDFDFGLTESDYNVNQNLQSSMNDLSGLGGQFAQQSQAMLNPNSTYNQRQFDILRRNIGDQSAQSINAMNAAMASRGMMGIGGAYDAIANRQAGDQFAQGQQGIINQGTQLASAMGNLAMGAYGQAGQLGAGVDARALQNEQFNTQNMNTYNQQRTMAEYNQAVQNQNAQAAYRNSQSNNLFNLAGSFLGLGR